MIELHVAIIVASLPPCRALALQLYRRARRQNPQSTGSNEATLFSEESGQRSKKRGLATLSSCNGEEGWIRMDHTEDTRSDKSIMSRTPLH
jgi:hypothetical protein